MRIPCSTIKVIELEDTFEDTSKKYPFVHSNKANIMFRLRSRLGYKHPPILLIEKQKQFTNLLPLQSPIDISKCQQDFIVLKGEVTKQGDWIAWLPKTTDSIIKYQLVFLQSYQSTVACLFGSFDVILLTQEKVNIRHLRKMSVFARCIGPVKDWLSFFERQNQLGYNTFHFAPIQQTGASHSYYSLKSHLQLSDVLFQGNYEQKYLQLKQVLKEIKQKNNTLFIDIVVNHVSVDAEWILKDLRAVFTIQNTPMLYTAYLVDEQIFKWGESVKKFMSGYVDIKNQTSDELLADFSNNLKMRLIDLQLDLYFYIDVHLAEHMKNTVKSRPPSMNIFAKDPVDCIEQFFQKELTSPNNKKRGRNLKDINKWIQLNLAYEPIHIDVAINQFNQNWSKKIIKQWIPQIITNTINEVKYRYFNEQKPQLFQEQIPIISKYFTKILDQDCLHNGWVDIIDQTLNPVQSFVTSKQNYCLRRKVHIWKDLLRVRYGKYREDSQYAWRYMEKYIRLMAQCFDGFRLDNLHNSQISLIKHLIREAKKVNPNLIVFAELFTKKEEDTIYFIRQIGINSVLKEAQHFLTGQKFVNKFHNSVRKKYIGSLYKGFDENGCIIKYSERKKPIPLIYDQTHDNSTYIQINKQVLMTPITVILTLSTVFTGSVKGFDQFYTQKIFVTQRKQLYKLDKTNIPKLQQYETCKIVFIADNPCSILGSWDKWEKQHIYILDENSKKYVLILNLSPGQYEYKFKNEQWYLNPKIRSNKNGNHYFEIEKQQCNQTIHPNLEQLRMTVSSIAQRNKHYNNYYLSHTKDIVVMIRQCQEGTSSLCIIANLSCQPQTITSPISLIGEIRNIHIWQQTKTQIIDQLSLSSEVIFTQNIREYFDINYNNITHNDQLVGYVLPSGFACVIQTKKCEEQINAIARIKQCLQREIQLPALGILDVNLLMFGCNQQEKNKCNSETYYVPQTSQKLVYAGFGGIYQMMRKAKKNSFLDLGIYKNLRAGNWLMDYFLERIKEYPHLKPITQKIQLIFQILKELPRYMIPKYFTQFVLKFVKAIQMNISNNNKSNFQRKLLLASAQFLNNFPKKAVRYQTTMSAGLPHFSTGWSRCWGRDTFISCELLCQHKSIFKDIILQFAGALRHGLIPNLLHEGNMPRYNCRDATWWFVRAVFEYIKRTNDTEILICKVEMLFLSDDQYEHTQLLKQGHKKVLLLEDIIHCIFETHAAGITFREWNAGMQIDNNMTSEGFNINLRTDEQTGFIVGGNIHNCLTWMDKMGSSVAAGIKGVPATSRSGAPVQLTALLYYCLKQFAELHSKGFYSHKSVKINNKEVLYSQWSSKIKENFQNYYYVKQMNVDKYITEIYKDSVMSQLLYEEHRFRPNALIAMAISPQLFQPTHAITFIKKVQNNLINPKSIGISSLYEGHSVYGSTYNNADNSNDSNLAHGFNYHNGPEWVWLYGYYIVAKANFQPSPRLKILLQQHYRRLQNDDWMSLPELTNRNGEYNNFSSPSQAWSINSIIMAQQRVTNQ